MFFAWCIAIKLRTITNEMYTFQSNVLIRFNGFYIFSKIMDFQNIIYQIKQWTEE
jgi:hypothetical protein